MTSGWTMTSRVMATGRGAAPPRTIVSVTTVPFGPRTFLRASSGVWPSTVVPSTADDPVAGQEAGLLGRAVDDGPEDDEPAVGTERRAAFGAVRLAARRRGADALELAGQALERVVEVVRLHVEAERVVERLEHPLDRAVHERLPRDRLARVVLGDRRVRVPERLERGGRVGRRARLGRRPGTEQEAGEEQAAPAEDEHEHGRRRRRSVRRSGALRGCRRVASRRRVPARRRRRGGWDGHRSGSSWRSGGPVGRGHRMLRRGGRWIGHGHGLSGARTLHGTAAPVSGRGTAAPTATPRPSPGPGRSRA